MTIKNLPWTFDEHDMRIRDAVGDTLAFVKLGYPAFLPELLAIGHLLARAPELLDDTRDSTDPEQCTHA